MSSFAVIRADQPAALAPDRVAALSLWVAAHPGHGRTDTVLGEAAALAPLTHDADGQPRFDDIEFGELAAFIAELPW